MIKPKKMVMYLELEVDVEGYLNPGYPETRPSMDNAGGEPGEPAHVEDLIVEFRGIDITKALKKREIAQLEEDFLELLAAEAEDYR